MIGVLVGGGLVYAISASIGQISPKTVTLPPEVVTTTQVATQTTTQMATQTSTEVVTQPAAATVLASVPSVPVSPVPSPTGWQTSLASTLGVSLLAEYNSSGAPAWDPTAHPVVYITTNGPGYGGYLSGLKTPGIAIIDAKTYQVVLTKQYAIANQTTYNEPHGLGVSMDGKYIYLVTGNPNAQAKQVGEIFVIDTLTLKLHQIIVAPAWNGFHHVTSFRLYNGTDVVLAIPFSNTGIESYFGSLTPVGTASPYFLMDDHKDNRVIGGFLDNQLGRGTYLAFPSPDGQHLFVGGAAVSVIDMSTWKVVNTYTWSSTTPFQGIGTLEFANMFAFTNDGKYAYWSSDATNTVYKVDNVAHQVVSVSSSPAAGPYGVTLNYNQTYLYTVGKGESTGNAGRDLGFMNAITMKGITDYQTGGLRGDHAITNPVHTDEIWISMNSNFEDVAWNTTSNTIDAVMPQSGSSHNGAFVGFTLVNGVWQGQLLSDQNGLHGAALIAQDKALGVTSVVYGTQTYKTEDQRALPGEPA